MRIIIGYLMNIKVSGVIFWLKYIIYILFKLLVIKVFLYIFILKLDIYSIFIYSNNQVYL